MVQVVKMDARVSRRMSITARFMSASILHDRGETATRVMMSSTFEGLERIAKEQRWGELSPENLTLKQFAKYVLLRTAEGISPRSLYRDISAIRRAMRGAGRSEDVANKFSDEALGAPSFPRLSTGTAIDADWYEEALSKAPPHIASLMRLQRLLGLRMGEALASRASLKIWAKVLALGIARLAISHGCEPGKERSIYVHPSERIAVANAIKLALEVTEELKTNTVSSADNLKQAKQHYTHELAALGFEGNDPSHSLRRAYATDQLQRYKADGHEDKDALLLLSYDLGHGSTPSGCKWVMTIYIKPELSNQCEDI